MFMKAAYTGVAASLVDGKTTHVIGSLSLGSKDDVSDATKKKLQEFWRNVRYLISTNTQCSQNPSWQRSLAIYPLGWRAPRDFNGGCPLAVSM
jgi:hypothetical protein